VRELPCHSIDGESISLQANGERREDLLQAIDLGVTGIGLYRTEFLHLRGMAPDEETQLAEYLAAVKTLDGLPLTIRTLDQGADKPIDFSDFEQPLRSANPALGLRAIRLCLRDTDQFKCQLRAILRASAAGPVRCLIPMLTSAREVVMVRSLLDESREELDESGLAYDPNLPLGGMIEVPAAALAIEEFSQNLDFISVGTNDLLQYLLAADRADEQVAHLYDLQHPGVVRLLRQIFRSAEASRIPVTVCGEVAGDRRYTRLLLALGLREFSMHPSRLLEVKLVITQTDIPRATAALTQWLNSTQIKHDISLLQLLDQSQQTH
jgi:phosphotransferase system enzyme I (PtsI)